ncbi:unnamed protein product [Adineta steineri]|uniref:G-protein coupled receptors family 3 profile domain-containing protein n=1 Tax=Adineta steineri TaxID=433720 RepID=A0A814XQX2_9BILA|nr:unnamed protein product [Adineta steineri]CAF1208101.1 unnamed protein product [Adineta steineri]CAF1219236.1 unnamed protein product [Adineta steineri]
MLLHDSFLFTSNQSLNETHYSPVTRAYSPLFRSTLTLIISIYGTCSNLICILYLYYIISKYKQPKLIGSRREHSKLVHILSHEKYKFLIVLTINDFFLCLSSIISCLDEKYFFQSLIARFRLCSLHMSIWKLTLHFSPLLTIFILFRYHYILYKRFPSKYFNTTTLNQLFCTNLCTLIPFVIAFAWSVDGLWLWGETNLNTSIEPIMYERNRTNETLFNITKLNNKTENYFPELYIPEQNIVCHLQTNDDLNLTTRIVYLIHADFSLLLSLHLIAFCLEIILHIRLNCCIIRRTITSSFLREQRVSIYILYIFICLTLTSLPFYLYRTIENFFYVDIPSLTHDIINGLGLAQIILLGISFKPVLYFILFVPSRILFKFKRYLTNQLDTNNITDILLIQEQKHRTQQTESPRYSLQLPSFYSRIHKKFRPLSNSITTHDYRSVIIDQNTTMSTNVLI